MAAQAASGRSVEPSPRRLLPEGLEDPAESESAQFDVRRRRRLSVSVWIIDERKVLFWKSLFYFVCLHKRPTENLIMTEP